MNDNYDDIKWLQQASQGSRYSFDHFYENYWSFIFHIAYQIVHDQGEAEDICHDVLLEVLQKPHEYKRSKGSVKAWIAVKTKSRSIDRLRKKKPLLMNKLEALLTHEEPLDHLILSQMEKDTLLDALEQLPKEQKEAIYRSYFQGKTHLEIANEMKRPLGTIKSFIRYGLNNLRKNESLTSWVRSHGGEKQNEI